MRRTMIAAAMLAVFASGPAQTGPVEDALAHLNKELAALKNDVASLKSMLARDTLGNVSFRATGTRSDTVGSDASSAIGGDHSLSIGKSSVTRIGGFRSNEVAQNDVLKVTGNRTANVGGNLKTTVGRDASHQVGGSMAVAVARSITIEAGDQILFKVGSASLLMQKSGDISITGTLINIKGSGDVVIKGSKVLTN